MEAAQAPLAGMERGSCGVKASAKMGTRKASLWPPSATPWPHHYAPARGASSPIIHTRKESNTSAQTCHRQCQTAAYVYASCVD